jgi:nucleoside-diphosphate-sugar epimerase
VSKLIVGCGYLGLRVARRWIAAGHTVAGVVHSEASAEALTAAAIRPIVADVTQPATLSDLPAVETLLYSVGYRQDAGQSRLAVYVDGLRAVLDAVRPDVRRVILTSSTGVYAEQSGGWVDEDSPCGPARESGRSLLAAEQVLAEHPLGDRGIVLRLAGIYGPSRLPRQTELAADGPLVVPAGHFVNLIHVDDAAAAVLMAEERAVPPRTYIIADGQPVDGREYLSELARQLGVSPPSFREPVPGEVASRRGGNKRARNQRMLDELQVNLAYPTYLQGLKAAVTSPTAEPR